MIVGRHARWVSRMAAASALGVAITAPPVISVGPQPQAMFRLCVNGIGTNIRSSDVQPLKRATLRML